LAGIQHLKADKALSNRKPEDGWKQQLTKGDVFLQRNTPKNAEGKDQIKILNT